MSSIGIYSTVVFVHVLAATVLLGSSLTFGLVRRAIRSAATVEELEGWLAFAGRSAAANPFAALVLLGTGVYLGSQGWWTEAWFHVALALWGVNLVVARRAAGAGAELGRAAAAARTGVIPPQFDDLRWSARPPLTSTSSPPHTTPQFDDLRWSARLDVSHDLLLASDVATLFIMFVKPGLLGSLAALAVAHGIAMGVRRRRRAARSGARVARPGEVVSMARS